MSVLDSEQFNPKNYQVSYVQDNDTDTISDEEKFDDIVTKGGNKMFKVDIGHFDKLCEKFRQKADMKIKHLKGRDKEDFKLMVSYVRLLYGTGYYEHLYEKVKKYFTDIPNVMPGTVGGYFGGCLVSTSFEKQPGCSAACAGSVPRPKSDEGWSFCDQAVVFADRDGNRGYSFTMLKEPENPEDLDPCYVFIEHTSLDDFEGFSKKEKKQLIDMGIENIYLIGCDENGVNYENLYGDMCNLSEIKERKNHNKSVDSNNSKLGLALLLIILFLLLAFAFFG
jgi:hypothetical protein